MTETSKSGGSEFVVPSEGAAGATSGATNDAATKEAATKKRVVKVFAAEKTTTVEAAVEKAVTDMAVADKTVADKAVANKAVVDKAVVDRATTDKAITNERVTVEADAKKTAVVAVAEKSTMESMDPDPTLALSAGSKRVATPSDSTPPKKHFYGVWKQRYAILVSCLFFVPIPFELC
jgi:hypothetical protein